MSKLLFQIDSFTDKIFAGNPAGVCILEEAADDRWMQNVAAEMNVSETAFLYSHEGGYRLRWFTPEVEVDLCGHATLASAHVLWEIDRESRSDAIRFRTNSGELVARSEGKQVQLNFPASPPQKVDPPVGLIEAIGTEAVWVGKTRFDYLLEFDTEEKVRSCAPDFSALTLTEARGVIVTSRAKGSKYDIISRFFAPAVGINEDPVTGSAHCALAPYWMERLGKEELFAYQASRRGGELRLRLENDRVILIGQAVTVFQTHIA